MIRSRGLSVYTKRLNVYLNESKAEQSLPTAHEMRDAFPLVESEDGVVGILHVGVAPEILRHLRVFELVMQDVHPSSR